MAENITISNSYFAYITNVPYNYPSDESDFYKTMDSTTNPTQLININTGWHIIPTMLWKHFCTPKAWFEMQINYEAYSVTGYTVQVFNMVPLTTQLAIGGQNVFTAFNNCVYALGYQDTLYETAWHNYYYEEDKTDFNLLYKEGLQQQTNSSTKVRFMLPTYYWEPTNSITAATHTWNMHPYAGNLNVESGRFADGVYPGDGTVPSGLVWDPLCRPDEIKELRPGKNSMGFTWERHECDGGKWFNMDQIASWFPYTVSGPYHWGHERPGEHPLSGMQDPNRLQSRFAYNPWVNDYTIPNWADMPVVPSQWWWKEMKGSMQPVYGSGTDLRLKYLNLFICGTEKECYHYPPTQSFLKMIPIITAENVNIECSAQVCIKTQLHLEVKKRRSAMYCPTWGPMPWRSVYSARRQQRNFHNSMIRYRSGGARRTWQNLADSNSLTAHPRQTPYVYTSTVTCGTGIDSTYTTRPKYTISTAKSRSDHTRVTPSAPPLEQMDISDPSQLYPPLDAFKRAK
uniref:Capsid protein n=1 Tax=Parvoviridae sp. TaxID=1940570 RepID=A0A7D3V4G3_9VIRU|nr:MAG: hypothetical protein [Parvoviridae sp.]